MSPEIRINGKLVADVPDETGLHQMLDGSPLYVDVNGIEARNDKQIMILEGPNIGGRRIVGLTQEGKGSTANPKKGGDRKDPPLEVMLHGRPIRVSYHDRKWVPHRTLGDPRGGGYMDSKRTYYNPRWIRGYG